VLGPLSRLGAGCPLRLQGFEARCAGIRWTPLVSTRVVRSRALKILSPTYARCSED
jgi:hypothetical protein